MGRKSWVGWLQSLHANWAVYLRCPKHLAKNENTKDCRNACQLKPLSVKMLIRVINKNWYIWARVRAVWDQDLRANWVLRCLNTDKESRKSRRVNGTVILLRAKFSNLPFSWKPIAKCSQFDPGKKACDSASVYINK